MSIIHKLGSIMSKFLDDIENTIKTIHLSHGVDNQTVAKEVSDAVTAGVAQLQSQITELQSQVADLQKAAQDTVAALTNGDIATAQATASAAAGASQPANDPASQAVS
jgi:hypothetical protein